jgi:hypothetical protein
MLDSLRGAIRSAIGAAEHVETDVKRAESGVERHNPLGLERQLDAKLDETLAALHRACGAAERHVEVLEGVAESLVPLTAAVEKLTVELNLLLGVLAPVAAAERDVSRIEGLFHRHRRHEDPEGESDPPPTTSGFHPVDPS